LGGLEIGPFQKTLGEGGLKTVDLAGDAKSAKVQGGKREKSKTEETERAEKKNPR